MEDKLPGQVKEVLDRLGSAGYQVYIVGGAVRDLLMKSASRRISDWDFTTDAKPEEILKLFPQGFYDNKFGTVGIPVSSLAKTRNEKRETRNEFYEITTMRKEGVYQDFRHPTEVDWTNKIKEDLARRDFTINAIALRLTSFAQGKSSPYEIIDPFNGQKDIQDKLIRAVGDPTLRFQEDALRLMRAVRIATELGFEIEKNTFQAICKNAPLIKEVSGERIRDELLKTLGSINPRLSSPDSEAPGGQAYIGIKLLREAGILQIILPELEKCFGIAQEGPKHARVYDIGEHSLLTLKHTPTTDPLVRLAALLHDIGKPETAKEEDGNITFYQHDVMGSRLALQIAKRFNLSKKQTDKLFRLIRWHLFSVDEKQTDSAVRRFIKNVGLENIEGIMLLRIGDRIGGGTATAVSWRMEKFKERINQVLQKPFSLSDLKVNGEDVMKVLNIPSGPKVGEILNKLFEEVLEDSSKNNRECLLNRIKNLE